MTQQGPGAGSGNEPGDESVSDDVQQLARQLRSSIQSFTQAELRRQERLTQFDQHLMQMEASIRDEVTRLRSTGSVVELVAGEVRRAVDGLARLGFDPTHEQLSALQQQVAALAAKIDDLPAPDDAAVLLGIDRLGDQLSALAAATASIRTQLPAIPDHAERLETLDAHTAEIRREVGRLAEVATAISHQTAPIGSVASELAAAAAAITALEARIEAGAAANREAADSQRLALARVVASADALSAALGAVRASIGTAVEAAGTATTSAIDAVLDDRLQATEARITEALETLVRQVDPQPMQQAMASQVASALEAVNRRDAEIDQRLDSLAAQLRALTEQLEGAPARKAEASTKEASEELTATEDEAADGPAPRAPTASEEIAPTESSGS